MLVQKSRTQFAEELPRPLGRWRGGCFVRDAGQEAGQGCWTCRNRLAGLHTGGGEELGRQSMLGPELAGDSSWWQAPPLLGGECLPFVSWLVNSLSPYLPSSICSQPSILPSKNVERGAGGGGVRGPLPVAPDSRGGRCLLYQTCSQDSTLKRSCSASDILCPRGPVSKSL